MGRLLALLALIHRRFLWQTFIIYVVAASVTFRVSSEVALRRDLPGWFSDLAIVLLIIGLPIVMLTSYVQGGVPALAHHHSAAGTFDEPPSPEDTPGDENRIRRIFTWRNAIIAGVAAFTLWAIAGAGWLYLASEIVDDARSAATQDSIVGSRR